MHMSKRTIAYVDGNSCRDVESIHCTLWKGICTCLFCCFNLLLMFVLAETVYLCRTFGELLRMHSGCFCYRSNNVWFWKEHFFFLNLMQGHEMSTIPQQKWRFYNTADHWFVPRTKLAIPICQQWQQPLPFFNAFNHRIGWWENLLVSARHIWW